MDITLEIKLECKTCGNILESQLRRDLHYYIVPCKSCLEEEAEYAVNKYKEEAKNAK